MADDPLVQRLLDMEIGPPVGTVPPDSFADGLRGMALAEAAPAGPAPAPEDDSGSTGDEGHVDADGIEGSDFGSAGPPLYSLKDADSDGGACWLCGGHWWRSIRVVAPTCVEYRTCFPLTPAVGLQSLAVAKAATKVVWTAPQPTRRVPARTRARTTQHLYLWPR